MPITHTVRSNIVIACAISGILAITPQVAAEDGAAFSLSANAALVSDYRFRGISLSDKDIALQGGFDISHESGFYVGTWGSSIESYAGPTGNASELELDIYGGYATTFGELDFDIGILAYTYPGSEGTTYWEPYASIGGAMGDVAWTLGATYAPEQDSIGGSDNLYVYLNTGVALAETGITLSGGIGYETGAFGDDAWGKNKWDWSLGGEYAFESFAIGVAYIDTNVADAGVVVSLSSSF